MKFNYLARTQKGELQTGSIEAVSQTAAIKILQSHNLVILSIEAVESTPFFARRIKIFERVKKKEVMIFCQQLSVLIEAEVPLVQSLKALHKQTGNPYFKKVIFEIANDVDGGMLFSKALAKHPKIFSSFYINLIKSGEVSGRLQESLTYLAKHLEKEYELMSRVRGAMIYPCFVLTTFIIIGVLMMVMVVPNLTAILQESNQALPWPTIAIIALSNLIRSWGWLFLVILVIISLVIWQLVQRPQGKELWDKIKLKLPLFGQIFQRTYLARFTENLSTLVQGGLPIIKALDVSAQVIGNTVFQKIIWQARDEVKAGKTISSVLEEHKEFPPLVSQMIKTGEKTGKLDYILKKIAIFYSREVDNIVSNLSQFIEPILIIGLGLMVAVLVAAILMPIYNIAGGI
jgi:type IV pilus assembly protein PilC